MSPESCWKDSGHKHIGRTVRIQPRLWNILSQEQEIEGEVVAWKPARVEDNDLTFNTVYTRRTPELFRVQYTTNDEDGASYSSIIQHQDLTEEDLLLASSNKEEDISRNEAVTSYLGPAMVERREDAIRHVVARDILPHLVILGALEVSFAELLESRKTEQAANEAAATATTTSSVILPKYYTAMPSASSFAANDIDSMATTSTVAAAKKMNDSKIKPSPPELLFQPPAVGNRVRLGCQLAYQYIWKQQQLSRDVMSVRRSSRQAATVENVKPHEYQQGGRVALYMLDLLEKWDEPEIQKDGDQDEDAASKGEEEYNVADNPYFRPTTDQLWDWLGRRGRSLSAGDIQEAICRCIDGVYQLDRIGIEFTQSLDMDKAVLGSSPTPLHVDIVCSSGEKFSDLADYEPGSFGKCKFAIRGRSTNEEQESDNEEIIEPEPELKPSTSSIKEDRLFQTWRYKGIQRGCTIWPLAWSVEVLEQVMVDTDEEEVEPKVASETTTTSADEDLALAKSLEDNDVGSSRRRTTRRSGDAASSVFYGSQSALSSKQLLETVHRLILQSSSKHKSPHTLFSLYQLMAEDFRSVSGSMDGLMARLRAALGKLYYSLGKIDRLAVSCVHSDRDSLQRVMVEKKGLISFPLGHEVEIDSYKGSGEAPPRENVHLTDSIGKTNGDSTYSGEVADTKEKGSGEPVKMDDKVEIVDKTIEQKLEADQSGPATVETRPWSTNDEKYLAVLTRYLRTLHATELQLRSLILSHLITQQLSEADIATAADERVGSMESSDSPIFEGNKDIPWSSSGHHLLNSVIRRPSPDSPESPCVWYIVKEYTPSLPLESSSSTDTSEVPASEGKDNECVERRMRFWAQPLRDGEGPPMVLTEAQVHAGLRAAEFRAANGTGVNGDNHPGHPFSKAKVGTKILLRPGQKRFDSAAHVLSAVVAGFDTVVMNESTVKHRILLLPEDCDETNEHQENGDSDTAIDNLPEASFWADVTSNSDEATSLNCFQVEYNSQKYALEFSDFHKGSKAYVACHDLIEYLQAHNKADFFLEPVDPEALGIPEYFEIIRHPMDLSTLLSNLEKGKYSNLPPAPADWTPLERMLQGPFQDDLLKIFDNATTFNPKGSVVHSNAAFLRKHSLKKIDDIIRAGTRSSNSNKMQACNAKKAGKSIYVDEDSDIDMYEYESDHDDEDFDDGRGGGRSGRKRRRSRGSRTEDFSTRAIEKPVKVPGHKSSFQRLGVLSGLSINTDAEEYALPNEWICRHKKLIRESTDEEEGDAEQDGPSVDIDAMIALQEHLEEATRSVRRRNTRAKEEKARQETADVGTVAANLANVEYFLPTDSFPLLSAEGMQGRWSTEIVGSDRTEIESMREAMHETYFSKLYQKYQKYLDTGNAKEGSFLHEAFPPYLGRFVPRSSWEEGGVQKGTWEIRSDFVVSAVRWVLRGLVNSGHLGELEPISENSDGVVLLNHAYYYNEGASVHPFDVLDVRAIDQQRRRQRQQDEEASSEEEVEMSEYEKMRAERVARNKERLKALGLA